MSDCQACDECGYVVEGGRVACSERFEEALARDFSDARYFSTHRLFVDCYSLQHPEQFCRSAKSLAAHLVGLCWIIEGDAAASVGTPLLRDWLNGKRELEKPQLPANRGKMTIGDLPFEGPPDEWRPAVHVWAETIWTAYAGLQPVAREWMRRASAEPRLR